MESDRTKHLPRCDADWAPSYFGDCGAPARYRIERTGNGYVPMNVCPTHLADAIASIVDGDDVPVTCHVYFDDYRPPVIDDPNAR
jgi:hypothetical protein